MEATRATAMAHGGFGAHGEGGYGIKLSELGEGTALELTGVSRAAHRARGWLEDDKSVVVIFSAPGRRRRRWRRCGAPGLV